MSDNETIMLAIANLVKVQNKVLRKLETVRKEQVLLYNKLHDVHREVIVSRQCRPRGHV